MLQKTGLLSLIALLMLIISCNTSPTNTQENSTDTNTHNTLSDEESEHGWELLFDGKTTKGWTEYGADTIGAAWKAVDSSLYLDLNDSTYGGDIVSKDSYEDFHLKLEWKIAPNGNSGIMFLVHEDPDQYKHPWQTGPEMQILDDVGHPEGQVETHRAGDLYDLISASKKSIKPAGEWIQVAILLQNGQLDFYLNGENVLTTTLWDDNWDLLVAGSKFKDMPGFAKYREGKISLQDHGDPVWFRNIKILRI